MAKYGPSVALAELGPQKGDQDIARLVDSGHGEVGKERKGFPSFQSDGDPVSFHRGGPRRRIDILAINRSSSPRVRSMNGRSREAFAISSNPDHDSITLAVSCKRESVVGCTRIDSGRSRCCDGRAMRLIQYLWMFVALVFVESSSYVFRLHRRSSLNRISAFLLAWIAGFAILVSLSLSAPTRSEASLFARLDLVSASLIGPLSLHFLMVVSRTTAFLASMPYWPPSISSRSSTPSIP